MPHLISFFSFHSHLINTVCDITFQNMQYNMLLGGCSRQTLRIDIISGDFMPRLEAHVGNEQNPDSGLKFTTLPRSCKHSGNSNSDYIKVTTTQIFQLMSSSEVHSAETAKFSHEPTMQLKASIRSLQTSFLLQSGITNIKQTK